ncbi:MAG: hypothetical protein JW751_31525 [Polyangiaceae bacterium]|nr:hypothetical protein [Polyangiaceae bacterium]
MLRHALYAVPAATVAIVAFSLLVVGAPRPVVGARLRGGPTDGTTPWSFQLEVVERRGASEQPVSGRPVNLELSGGRDPSATWSGSLDPEGRAEVGLSTRDRSASAPTVTVTAPWARRPLARGMIHLPRATWWGARHERGGTVDSPSPGPLRLRVSPGRGALAVPFPTPLLVEVRWRGEPVAGARITARGEGVEVLDQPPATNARGRTRLIVQPTSHIAALELLARDSAEATGRWYATLPVVGGALHATSIAAGAIEVVSPIPRDAAYYALIDERGRLAGGRVPLAVDPQGTASGRVTLVNPPPTAWLVVSSEPDLASPGAVGWPLADPTAAWLAGTIDDAPRSVTIPETLLLDGVRPAVELEAARQAQVRRLTALFVAMALALVVLLLVLRVERAAAKLDAHLRRAAGVAVAAELVPTSGRSLIAVGAAVLAVALGFLVLLLLSLLRVA